ncbi:unnamed protein product [Laminaria digitata]
MGGAMLLSAAMASDAGRKIRVRYTWCSICCFPLGCGKSMAAGVFWQRWASSNVRVSYISSRSWLPAAVPQGRLWLERLVCLGVKPSLGLRLVAYCLVWCIPGRAQKAVRVAHSACIVSPVLRRFVCCAFALFCAVFCVCGL